MIAAVLMAAGLSLSSAYAGSLNPSVKIESVGNLKFLVASDTQSGFVVKLYNDSNDLLHQESIHSKKMFNLVNLSDGNYRMEIYDLRKNLVSKKDFVIKTETKRDVIAQN